MSATGLLLFPGAGSASDHPSLLAIERHVAPTACRRRDFPYRLAGRRAPDRAPVLLATVRSEIAAWDAAPLFVGGRSMGGRIASMVAAGDTAGALDPVAARVAGLVLISYPLHPPGKPDRLRVEHLERLSMPCLFVSGTRDAFGAPDELRRWTDTIPGEVTHAWIDGRGHDLRRADDEVGAIVAEWVRARTA